jgi:hypothetical protein
MWNARFRPVGLPAGRARPVVADRRRVIAQGADGLL